MSKDDGSEKLIRKLLLIQLGCGVLLGIVLVAIFLANRLNATGAEDFGPWFTLAVRTRVELSVNWVVYLTLFLLTLFRPAWLRHARRKLLARDRRAWAILVSAGLLLVYFQPVPFFRRVALFVEIVGLMTLLLPEVITLAKQYRGLSYYPRLAVTFVAVGLAIKLIPGGYFPPYFGGIAGWKFAVPESDTVTLTGLQLVRDDEQTVWYSGDLVLPQSFHFRQYLTFDSDDAKLIPLLDYYEDLYVYNYSHLERGLYGNQQFLGTLSYPAHMTSVMLDYASFPPDRITSIRRVDEVWNRKNKQRESVIVHWVYDFESRTLTRKSK